MQVEARAAWQGQSARARLEAGHGSGAGRYWVGFGKCKAVQWASVQYNAAAVVTGCDGRNGSRVAIVESNALGAVVDVVLQRRL